LPDLFLNNGINDKMTGNQCETDNNGNRERTPDLSAFHHSFINVMATFSVAITEVQKGYQ